MRFEPDVGVESTCHPEPFAVLDHAAWSVRLQIEALALRIVLALYASEPQNRCDRAVRTTIWSFACRSKATASRF